MGLGLSLGVVGLEFEGLGRKDLRSLAAYRVLGARAFGVQRLQARIELAGRGGGGGGGGGWRGFSNVGREREV